MINNFPITVIEAIRKTIGQSDAFTALHEPYFMGNEWTYVKECLDTGWVSSAGKYVDLFEKKLAEFTGVKRAVAVVNGTAALHMCLILAGIKSLDEVLIPALTFVATANAVSYCGAIPHFVDIDPETLGVDPHKLDDYLSLIGEMKSGVFTNKFTQRPLRAVIPMHTFGQPVDLDKLTEVCAKYNLILIEDAAESLGSYYKERHTGSYGLLSAISFNGNKIITTGGGGAILTNNEQLADTAKHITTTAKASGKWLYYHDMVGYNYRLPNLNAALGCAQLEQIEDFISNKRKLANQYKEAFQDIDGIQFYTECEFSKSNYWLNVLLLDPAYASYRDEILAESNRMGIQTRPVWTLLNKLPMYKDCPRMELTVSEDMEKRMINIPSSVFLGGNDE